MVCCSHEHTYTQAHTDQSFPRDLLRLNVARNSLNEVPSEALLQLKNLNQLDLSFNKIKYIEENTFAGIVFYHILAFAANFLEGNLAKDYLKSAWNIKHRKDTRSYQHSKRLSRNLL